MHFPDFLKKRWMILLAAVLVLTAGILTATTVLNRPQQEAAAPQTKAPETPLPAERLRLDLTPSLEDKSGIDTGSDFKLVFPKDTELDAASVQQGLKITPAIDYDLEKADDGIVIKPKYSLQEDNVYTFKLSIPGKNIKESWAFQTRREFKIVYTLPANRSNNVPLDTGIEITFSHADIKDFEKNFSIEPKTEGRFEYHKNIAVFVPKELKANTIYTVKVGKGVSRGDTSETLQEDCNFSFQTQTPGDPDGSRPYFSFTELINNFPTDKQPVLKVITSGDYKAKDFKVALYRYESADLFIKDCEAANQKPYWAVNSRDEFFPELSGKAPFREYVLSLETMEKDTYMSYLSLPENLPEGYFLTVVQSGDRKDYSFIQINDMQLYLTKGKKQALVWINDILTGEAVSGAVFEGNGMTPVTTDKDGIAVAGEDIFKNKTDQYVFFKASREGHPSLIAAVSNWGEDWTSSYDYQSNWSYLYLDRSTYLPTDTVKLWGYLRPRAGGNSPKTVKVNLIKDLYDYRTYQSSRQVLQTREVSLSPAGSYTAKFSFENLPSTNYTIQVELDGKIVSSAYLYISKYIKSPYIVSAQSDHKVYLAGETMKAQVGCEFFEGTPVPGYKMNYSIRDYSDYQNGYTGSLTLDEQGKGVLGIRLNDKTTAPMSWKPLYHNLYVNNKDPEETEVYDYEYFYVFPRDVMVSSKSDWKGNTANLHFETNSIDISGIRDTGEFYTTGEEPLYKGKPIDRTITATLYERYWDKKETGEYYDIINKKKIKTYDYFEVKNVLGTYEIQTTGGKADYTMVIPEYSDKKAYYVTYATTDSKGRPILEETWLYGQDGYWYGYYDQNYYFLEFDKEEPEYKVGESVSFSLKKNNNEPIKTGKVLYMVQQEGILDFWTSGEAAQSMDFTEKYVPNAYIEAVYFDGRMIHTPYGRMIRFDYSDKELDITLQTDKESYRPGEMVKASVTVRDKSGNPVKADVNLSAVDEAYFALYSQEVDTIGELYRSVYSSGMSTAYISYQELSSGTGGAEGGEGDDEGSTNNVRKDFVDSAYFETAETDSGGRAEFSFRLPDNLTSWRLTYQAITNDRMAGNGRKNITTRLPFFVKAVMNDTFLAGDLPSILLKGYGEGVSQNDQIAFKVSLKDSEGKVTSLETKAKQGEYAELSLPELSEGIYTVTAEGKIGNLSDAVEKTIQVRKSLTKAKKVDYHTVVDGLKLTGIDSYATLSFYNANLDDYYRSLTKLYWSWGNRLDQIVARNEAGELLKQHFQEGYYSVADKIDVSPYQKEDGGLALLPYGSSETELSAKMAALCAGDINTDSLAAYFSAITEDSAATPLQVSAAYWGLASLRKPVLLELKEFMVQGDLMLDEKLYLANALAELGALKEAESLYNEIDRTYGTDLKPYRYIKSGGNSDSTLRLTSLMALLAVKIDAAEKTAYFKYIESKSTDEILINLERLLLVKQELPEIKKPASFTLEVNGKKEQVPLTGTEPYTLMLSPESLKTLELSQVEGDVALSVSYEALQEPGGTEPVVKVERTYNKALSPITLGRTDTVTVNLSLEFLDTAPEGYYEVTDVLPAGLRFIYSYQSQADTWYFGRPDEGQRVRLYCYYGGKKDQKKRSLSYVARVSAPGSYTADRALVRHSQSDAAGYSEKASIRIR